LSRIRSRLFNLIAAALYRFGAARLLHYVANRYQLQWASRRGGKKVAIRARASRNLQILIYHRVNDDGDLFFPGVPSRVFEQQMKYLAGQCHVLRLDEAVNRMKECDLPDNAVAITFDDGYRDNYTHAFPILKSLELPATIFLATSALEGGEVLWHDRVFSAFRETRVETLPKFGEIPTSLPCRSPVERLHAQGEVLKFLRRCDSDEIWEWVQTLENMLSVTYRRPASELMLNWEEIRIMAKAGIQFGAHTVSHPILSRLTVERARDEIVGSKLAIEKHLDREVFAFAYPNGTSADYSAATKALAKDAGYLCALTTEFGSNDADSDRYELRRATPWGGNLHSFALRLGLYKLSS
jgi:peptidoglycan/xylan/chitin deacetylase (PgdA/CDA1 family)